MTHTAKSTPRVTIFSIIAGDMIAGHPQRMAIMNLVWPINALYLGPIAVWAYWTMGRPMAMRQQQEEMQHHAGGHAATMPSGTMMEGRDAKHRHTLREKPFWQTVFVGVCHCGAGCTLGDIIAEFAIFFVGVEIAGVASGPS